jgi:alcohol dehydrogenase (cytochrome c)
LQWYFQHIPNDMTDYDSIGTELLVDTMINGAAQRVVAQFHRNGFFYRHDLATGEFISATPYIEELNWTAGIDPKTGRPVEYDPNVDLQVYAFGAQRRGGPTVYPCPHQHGGVNYQATAYNPENGRAYAMSQDFGCYEQSAGAGFVPADAVPGRAFMAPSNGGFMRQSGDAPQAVLVAFDVSTGEKVAQHNFDYAAGNGGTTVSPGLVWSGMNDGTFAAFDATTLEMLWSTNTGVGQKSGASIYAVDGKEYVALLASPASAHGYASVSAKPQAIILFVFTL